MKLILISSMMVAYIGNIDSVVKKALSKLFDVIFIKINLLSDSVLEDYSQLKVVFINGNSKIELIPSKIIWNIPYSIKFWEHIFETRYKNSNVILINCQFLNRNKDNNWKLNSIHGFLHTYRGTILKSENHASCFKRILKILKLNVNEINDSFLHDVADDIDSDWINNFRKNFNPI